MRCKEFLFLLIPFLLFIACDRIEEDPKGDEAVRLDAWIKVNNIVADTITPDGLYFINEVEGTGAYPSDSNYLVYNVTIRNLDDYVYSSTIKDTAKLFDLFSYTSHYVPAYSQYFTKSFTPKGLREGLKMMKEGGKARLIMKSNLAFGKYGSGDIGSYESLIFDVELVKVVPDPKVYEKSQIDEYLANNPGFVNYNDSVYIKIMDDDAAVNHYIGKDTLVYVFYTGRFLDGYVFDTNVDTVAVNNHIYSTTKSYAQLSFNIGDKSVTEGFEYAIKHMKAKTRIRALIPSAYEYGSTGKTSSSPTILPYSPLIFDIYLYQVGESK